MIINEGQRFISYKLWFLDVDIYPLRPYDICVVSFLVPLPLSDMSGRTRWTFEISSVALKQELARRTVVLSKRLRGTGRFKDLKRLQHVTWRLGYGTSSWDSSINLSSKLSLEVFPVVWAHLDPNSLQEAPQVAVESQSRPATSDVARLRCAAILRCSWEDFLDYDSPCWLVVWNMFYLPIY